MSLKRSVHFGYLVAFFVAVIIISRSRLLSPCPKCPLRELKLCNNSRNLHPPAIYEDSILKEDEADDSLVSKEDEADDSLVSKENSIYDGDLMNDDSNNRERTAEFLERKSLSFTHYNSRMAFFTYFSGVKKKVCMILKNGHSAIKFVSCLLTIKEEGDEKKFKKFDSLLTFKGAFDNACMRIAGKPKIDSATYERLVFIRDPLERFISGYLFLCKRNLVCFNCGQDFGCFLKTLYLCWKTQKNYAKICTYKSPSPESKHNTSGHLYSHMSPQVASCDLLHRRKEFKVIEYSTENINNFLLSAARPLLVGQEYENLKGRLQQKTIHAASENDAEELEALIRANRSYASMFAELYYMDYKTFNIEIPRFIVDYKLFENKK